MKNNLFDIIVPRPEDDYSDKVIRLFPELFPTDTLTESNVKSVTFQVTDNCNMACTYCYQINKHHHKMDIQTAKKFLDRILDLENPDPYINLGNTPGIILEFIGGEPFLEVQLIDQICDYFMQTCIKLDHPWLTKFRISICSNGLLYFTPEVQKFITKWNYVLSFSISIDGNKKLHDSCRVDLNGEGTYDRAIAAVKHYVSHFKGDIGSKMTLAPNNIMHTKEAVIGLLENGYKKIHLNCVYEEGWNYDLARILYFQLKELADYILDKKIYKDINISMFDYEGFHPMDETDNSNWCGGVNNLMLSVDYKGDIYPCIRYMESSLGSDQKPVIIGNIEHGIYVTEEEKAWKEELSDVTRKNQSTEECWNCPIAFGCAWCSAYNYQKFGTVRHRATFICPMHKATSLANAYYWNNVLRELGLEQRFKIWCPKEWALEIIPEEEWNLLKQLESTN